MRFVLIGAGMVSDAHARSLRELPGSELAMVYSRTEARAKALAGKYGVPWSTDLDAALGNPDADAAIVATAPHKHAAHAIAAMQHGKHALVEKPMSISTVECDRMMSVAQETGRTLGVVFQNRFKKGVRRAKEFIDRGRLGGLLHLSGYVKWYRSQSYYEANDWRGRVALEGGGVIFSQAGHTLDLLRWIGGPVSWVFTNMITAPVHRHLETENLGCVALRFANGATGVLEASTALFPGAPERLEIHGTRGTIGLEAGNITRWEIKDRTPEDEPGDTHEASGTGASDPMAFPITWHRALIADFIQAVREGRPPAVDGREGRLLNELCEAIYRSARQQRLVHLHEPAT